MKLKKMIVGFVNVTLCLLLVSTKTFAMTTHSNNIYEESFL